MESIFSIGVICLIWGILIFLTIKGKMNWASSLVLFLNVWITVAIGLILMYALPKGEDVHVIGPTTPILPFTVSIFIFLFSIYATRKLKIESKELPAQQSNIRFVLLALGILFQLCALVSVEIIFYTPKILGMLQPNPAAGVGLYFIFNCLSAVFLYLVSIRNTITRPNLMRWIVFFLILFLKDFAIVISLILIYAFPTHPLTIYPFWAGINTISYIPYSILILFLAKGYIYSKV
jgi:hypothetical protein